MKLSLRFFYTKIAERYPGTTVHVSSGTMPAFSSLGVITNSTVAAREVVYVDLLPRNTERFPAGISVITTQSRSALFEDCNIIALPDNSDLADAAQIVSNTLMRYLGWADSIYEAISRNVDLQTIVDLTTPIFENPLYIADSSFKMLARWSGDFGEVNPTWRYQEKYLYLPYGVMQNLIESGELKKLFESPNAWIVQNSTGFTALPFLSKAIRKDGIHYGNFFVIEFYKQLSVCDLELADYLGMVLSTALHGNLNYLQTSTLYHNHFLEDIIMGTLTDERIVLDQLKALHWEMRGDYLITLFNTTQDNEAIRQHMMAFLTSEFAAQCFSCQGLTVAIFNDSTERRDMILKRLSYLARDFNRTASISEHFSDFSQINKYFIQADFALSCADEQGARGKVFDYCDVFLEHLNEVVDAVVPCYAPALLLKKHDERYGTEYCMTLLSWLMCDRNTVHAAEELFVHRNTLKNRLERIARIAKVDLDDPKIRLRLQLSLYSLVRNLRL